jgi:hypothetical protein
LKGLPVTGQVMVGMASSCATFSRSTTPVLMGVDGAHTHARTHANTLRDTDTHRHTAPTDANMNTPADGTRTWEHGRTRKGGITCGQEDMLFDVRMVSVPTHFLRSTAGWEVMALRDTAQMNLPAGRPGGVVEGRCISMCG